MKKSIALEEAEEGMILANAVTDDRGMTLCAEGTPVTERLMNLLRQKGVTAICIESDEEMSEDDYLLLKQKIEKRFVAVSDPACLLGKLKIAVLERLEYKKG